MNEARNGSKFLGRDHHPRAFTMWLAGGGIKPGITIGQTDELGYNVVEDPVDVHDLHATMLHLLGIDHAKLTYRFQGRDFRLTDVHGKVVQEDPRLGRATSCSLAMSDQQETTAVRSTSRSQEDPLLISCVMLIGSGCAA